MGNYRLENWVHENYTSGLTVDSRQESTDEETTPDENSTVITGHPNSAFCQCSVNRLLLFITLTSILKGCKTSTKVHPLKLNPQKRGCTCQNEGSQPFLSRGCDYTSTTSHSCGYFLISLVIPYDFWAAVVRTSPTHKMEFAYLLHSFRRSSSSVTRT